MGGELEAAYFALGDTDVDVQCECPDHLGERLGPRAREAPGYRVRRRQREPPRNILVQPLLGKRLAANECSNFNSSAKFRELSSSE